MEKATTEVHTNCYGSKEDSAHSAWEPAAEGPAIREGFSAVVTAEPRQEQHRTFPGKEAEGSH